jgi:hypothetical protein
VLNAGVRGYGLDQMVLRAERLVPEIKPSTVFDAKAAAGQHEALTEVLGCAAKAGLPMLNTFAAFEKENVGHDIDLYFAMMHFTDRGGAIAARSIAMALAIDKSEAKER